MTRYIDAEKLIDFKFSYITNERYKDGRRKSEEEIYAYKVGYNEAIDNIIQFATTADVVEVVRCKDCKYYNHQHHYCEGIGNWFGFEGEWSDNGFCYKGERKCNED